MKSAFVMRYLCCDFVLCNIFVYFLLVLITCTAGAEFDSDVVYYSNKPTYFRDGFYNGYPYATQKFLQQRKTASRSSRGIPIDLALKLIAVKNEEELFKHYIENGRELLANSNSRSQITRPSRRSDDGPVRQSRVADVRQLSKSTENDPHFAFASVGANPRNNRVGTGATTSRLVGGNSSRDAETRVYKYGTDSSVPIIPKPAVCEPELRTVSLRDSDDPTLFYHQSCTRVKRCGGCCSHDLLSCQPKAVQYTNYSVNVSKYTGKDKLKYLERRIITVEEHLNCTCQCKIKETDCSPQQKYEKDNCRCVCTNAEAEDKCALEHKIKLWDQPSCSCRCRDISDCSSGYYFDEAVCRCVQIPPSNILPDYSFDQSRFRTAYGLS